MDLEELVNNVLAGNITNQVFVDLGIIILIIAGILILISIIIIVVANKRSKEEKIASKLLKTVKKMRDGKFKPKVIKEKKVIKNGKQVIKKEKPIIKKDELTLKQMLIKKFKPLIEKQLHSKVEFVDFKANKEKFMAKIKVQDHMLELTMDSSGKILDYKNLDDQ